MKKGLKIILFLVFTVVWSIIVYLINGEWLYFIPLLIADVLFFETISWQFWKKKKEKKEKRKKSELRNWIEAIAFAVVSHLNLHLHLHCVCTCMCTCICTYVFAIAFALAFVLAYALAYAFAKPKRSQNGPKTDPNGGENQVKAGRTGLDRTGWGRIRVGSDFGRLHLQKSYVLPSRLHVAAIRASPQITGNRRTSPETRPAQLQTLPIC